MLYKKTFKVIGFTIISFLLCISFGIVNQISAQSKPEIAVRVDIQEQGTAEATLNLLINNLKSEEVISNYILPNYWRGILSENSVVSGGANMSMTSENGMQVFNLRFSPPIKANETRELKISDRFSTKTSINSVKGIKINSGYSDAIPTNFVMLNFVINTPPSWGKPDYINLSRESFDSNRVLVKEMQDLEIYWGSYDYVKMQASFKVIPRDLTNTSRLGGLVPVQTWVNSQNWKSPEIQNLPALVGYYQDDKKNLFIAIEQESYEKHYKYEIPYIVKPIHSDIHESEQSTLKNTVMKIAALAQNGEIENVWEIAQSDYIPDGIGVDFINLIDVFTGKQLYAIELCLTECAYYNFQGTKLHPYHVATYRYNPNLPLNEEIWGSMMEKQYLVQETSLFGNVAGVNNIQKAVDPIIRFRFDEVGSNLNTGLINIENTTEDIIFLQEIELLGNVFAINDSFYKGLHKGILPDEMASLRVSELNLFTLNPFNSISELEIKIKYTQNNIFKEEKQILILHSAPGTITAAITTLALASISIFIITTVILITYNYSAILKFYRLKFRQVWY